MIVAQTILVTPVVAALTRQVVEDLHHEYDEVLKSLGVKGIGRVRTLLWDARYSLITVALAGFGRAVAEVGAGAMCRVRTICSSTATCHPTSTTPRATGGRRTWGAGWAPFGRRAAEGAR